MNLEDVMTNYDIQNFDGFRVITPVKARTPLEVITSGPSVPNNAKLLSESLRPLNLSLKYSGPQAVLFTY